MGKYKINPLRGMAIVLLTVVMPLTFLFSCFREKQDMIDVDFDPQTSHTLKETNVVSLISDSGITRYKFITATWLIFGKASEPYWFFPDGIYIEKFDTLFNIETSIKADTAYNYERRKLWEAKGNVDITNFEGKRFQTEQLFWNDQDKDFPFYTDSFITIIDGDNISMGYGFRANQDLSFAEIYNASGEYAVETQRSAAADSIPSAASDSIPALDSIPPAAPDLIPVALDSIPPVAPDSIINQ